MTKEVVFSIPRSELIEEVEEGSKYETLSKCLTVTMPSLLNIVVHELLRTWSKPEYADDGFQFSVSKAGLLSYGPEKSVWFIRNTNIDTMMKPLVDSGYAEFHFKVRNGKAKTKGGSSWVHTYRAVSMKDAFEIAKAEFNKQVISRNEALDGMSSGVTHIRSVTVGIISDPRAGSQKSKIKRILKNLGKDRDKSLFWNFMTNAETNPVKGDYYDAVLVVGKTQGAMQVFEARKEVAKRKKLGKKERAFDNEEEFLEYVDTRLNKKRKTK